MLLVAFALAAPTAEETASLAAGEVVIHSRSPRRAGAIRVEAIIDIKAERARVWAALLDFRGRMPGNPTLKLVEPYRPATATEQWWRFRAERFGTSVSYHNHYVLSADQSRLSHELDPSQANDLVWSEGVYSLGSDASCSGCTRLTYDVESDFGVAMPGFVTRWLAGSGVKDFLVDLGRRAEGR